MPSIASTLPTDANTDGTDTKPTTTTSRTRRLGRVAAAPMAVAALAVAGLPLAATAEADPNERKSRPSAGCLWAGKTYAEQTTVRAGGTTFRCGTNAGAPYWFAGQAAGPITAAPSPGAVASPIGQFSPGARQPGTSYNDYCVGNQLIPGTDDVYQVVRVPSGATLWKAAHPIDQWTFDDQRPSPTWRTASLCIDGVLT
ncbi:hypothetical protein [Nocardia heshunensis]